MAKFIKVKKILSENRFNIHYINVFHIVDFCTWNECTEILLSNNQTVEVTDTVQEILEKINNI